ncbi:hypothetical protein D1007_23090 [Hordeum vulgare]|nr:hypothetical protein D1007_23090 [Hordeum vulgare]
MRDEFPPMDEETTLCMDESGTICLRLKRAAPSIDRNVVISEEEQQLVLQPGKFTFAMLSFTISDAMNNKHRLRKGKGLERITKSLGTKVAIQIAEGMKHPEKPLQAAKFASECGLIARSHLSVLPHFKEYKNNATLLEDYIGKVDKEERKGEELSAIDLFKATHNSKKHGFSEPVKIAILEMEKRKDAPVPQGEEPKSDAEIVEEVLKTEVKQSTFLRNIGLKSSSYNYGKGTSTMGAHVRDLEQKLERSELQAEVLQEEMAAIKMQVEEYEAARNKELELLRKKSQE